MKSPSVEWRRVKQKMNTSRQEGFTLVELLTVVGVMVIVASIIVSNSFGMSKGAMLRSAREIPFNTLNYAHQRACMDGKTTIVHFSSEESVQTLGIYQAAGIITESNGKNIYDKYNDVATVSDAKNLRIWNFTKNEGSRVKKIMRQGQAGKMVVQNDTSFGIENHFREQENKALMETQYFVPRVTLELVESKGNWQIGDSYGFEISDRNRLPKDYVYTSQGASGTDGFYVTFYSDGSSDDVTISITDSNRNSMIVSTIEVKNGQITMKDK